MPSGKTHAVATTVAASALPPLLALTAGLSLQHAIAFGLGCLTGLVVNPDLDVDHGSNSHSLVKRYAGNIVALFWFLFWWPYARLIPHRSPLSHFPILGTILRLVYLLTPLYLIWLWLTLSAPQIMPPPAAAPWMGWAFTGLAIVDGLHTLMDFLF